MAKVYSLEIAADLETPVSAYLKLKNSGACFLLESTENVESLGRYSFIGVNPLLTVTSRDNSESVANLRKFMNKSDSRMPALLGGLVGYVSYEMAGRFEKLPAPGRDLLGMPEMCLVRPESIVMFDHFRRKMCIFSVNAGSISQIRSAFKENLPEVTALKKSKSEKQANSNFSPAQYARIVKKAQAYIKAGDIFQVVLAHCQTGETNAPPFQVYRAMRILNPSPYMFFFESGDFCLAGSSPEMLVKLENGNVILRPIAGTRPRGKIKSEDTALENELLANPKENAEHAMLVDLGRNDLGRVCEFGSVNITELRKIERYSHVMHLVSTVSGRLGKKYDMFDLFQAVFPAGTVTGAPKIRAMEIISRLERLQRGPYAGAMGYFGSNGNMDMCLTIRTIIFKGNKYFIYGGAGIVYDSIPSEEYTETMNKTAALKKAIQMAEQEEI